MGTIGGSGSVVASTATTEAPKEDKKDAPKGGDKKDAPKGGDKKDAKKAEAKKPEPVVEEAEPEGGFGDLFG